MLSPLQCKVLELKLEESRSLLTEKQAVLIRLQSEVERLTELTGLQRDLIKTQLRMNRWKASEASRRKSLVERAIEPDAVVRNQQLRGLDRLRRIAKNSDRPGL